MKWTTKEKAKGPTTPSGIHRQGPEDEVIEVMNLSSSE